MRSRFISGRPKREPLLFSLPDAATTAERLVIVLLLLLLSLTLAWSDTGRADAARGPRGLRGSSSSPARQSRNFSRQHDRESIRAVDPDPGNVRLLC